MANNKYNHTGRWLRLERERVSGLVSVYIEAGNGTLESSVIYSQSEIGGGRRRAHGTRLRRRQEEDKGTHETE